MGAVFTPHIDHMEFDSRRKTNEEFGGNCSRKEALSYALQPRGEKMPDFSNKD